MPGFQARGAAAVVAAMVEGKAVVEPARADMALRRGFPQLRRASRGRQLTAEAMWAAVTVRSLYTGHDVTPMDIGQHPWSPSRQAARRAYTEVVALNRSLGASALVVDVML